MKRICATLGGQRFEIPWEGPALLSDLLAPHGFSLPCGGAHTCGACRVTAYGELSPLSAEEKRLLTTEEQLSNVRLACCARALGSCTVHALSPPRPRVQKGGTLPAAAGEPPFGRGHVLAADIGTTTVAAYLCDPLRPDGPAAAGELNAQAPFGADVITRIGKCAEIGVRPLREALAGQLDRLFAGLLRGRGVRPDRVRGVVLTGNTAMLHLFAGLDPAGLAAAPYTPQSLFGVLYNAWGYFPTLPPAVPVYLAPCVGAFVGADTVCALLACRLEPRELLLDVGTNGELALMTEEGALCCSAAAGPAFEERAPVRDVAADGAICAAAVRDGGIVCRTIGGGPPRGVCGTGAVSLLAALLELGAVDETGLLDRALGGGLPARRRGGFHPAGHPAAPARQGRDRGGDGRPLRRGGPLAVGRQDPLHRGGLRQRDRPAGRRARRPHPRRARGPGVRGGQRRRDGRLHDRRLPAGARRRGGARAGRAGA